MKHPFLGLLVGLAMTTVHRQIETAISDFPRKRL